jgi:hypothetical protein
MNVVIASIDIDMRNVDIANMYIWTIIMCIRNVNIYIVRNNI